MNSFRYAGSGIMDLFKKQANARIHLFVALIVVLLSIFLKIDKMECFVIIMLIGMVFSAELINTSIEYLADQVSDEYTPLIKRSKDAAAAAVLIIAVSSVIIGLIIYVPRIMDFLDF